MRTAAEQALAALGPAAAGELISTAAWGRRRARDRAAALLADLPVTPVTIDRLVDAELDALEQTAAALAVLTEPGDELLARRLDERLREIAHTVLLLVAARRRSRAIARAAAASRAAARRAIDALIVIEDGELRLADRRIGKGEVVDELACVAPVAAVADLATVRSSRLIRLERGDFEELVDDVPGLASAVCRALGERARRAEDAGYRSPLASRGG